MKKIIDAIRYVGYQLGRIADTQNRQTDAYTEYMKANNELYNKFVVVSQKSYELNLKSADRDSSLFNINAQSMLNRDREATLRHELEMRLIEKQIAMLKSGEIKVERKTEDGK